MMLVPHKSCLRHVDVLLLAVMCKGGVEGKDAKRKLEPLVKGTDVTYVNFLSPQFLLLLLKTTNLRKDRGLRLLANKVSTSFEISSASHASAFALAALPLWRWCIHTG